MALRGPSGTIESFYGNCVDGPQVYPVGGTLGTDVYASNMTIYGTLLTEGYKIFVAGTLTIGNPATPGTPVYIKCNGADGANGTVAGPGSGGGIVTTNATLYGGTGGGNGGSAGSNGSSGSNGDLIYTAHIGGGGGSGGGSAGSGHSGGGGGFPSILGAGPSFVGGTSGSTGTLAPYWGKFAHLINFSTGCVFGSNLTTFSAGFKGMSPIGGGTGGGGGGGGATFSGSYGGGGGSGGGIILIFANRIVNNSTFWGLEATGGRGGNGYSSGVSGGGGGGSGGGGAIIIGYNEYVGAAPNTNVLGGTQGMGAGGGYAGGMGATGTVIIRQGGF